MLILSMNVLVAKMMYGVNIINGGGSSIGRASDCGSECCGIVPRPLPHMED